MIILIVIGLVSALISGSMASSRNRSGLGWGIFGFFFGFIPIIILAIIGRQAPASYQPVAIAAGGGSSNLDQLSKLKGLLDQGVISQSEFDAQKRKLLSN